MTWALVDMDGTLFDHDGALRRDTMNIDIVGRDKGGTYGRVLVDDYPKYLADWLKHRQRGLAIMPAHSYNEGFTHPNVIRYDGTNKAEVYDALRAAYERKSNQHWKRSTIVQLGQRMILMEFH